MNVSAYVLKTVCKRGNPAILSGLAEVFARLVDEFDLSTAQRQAAFVGMCAEETDGYRTMTEYASGREYEGRRDLGNTHRGDGPRFKGRGLIQVTGRANYEKYGERLGIDLAGDPEEAAQFPAAALVAAEYWRDHRLNEYADDWDLRTITRRINGGLNGFAMRKAYCDRALRLLQS